MIDNMRRHMRRVFWLFVFLFALTAGYLIKLATVDARAVASNPYNRRLGAENADRLPGMILDRRGNIIAESVPHDSGYTREYPYGRVFSHILGTHLTKTGVETKYNFDLQKLDMEAWQRLDNLFSDRPVEGNSVVTTLDAGLQQAAYDALAKTNLRGAVVAVEPSTGRILASVSAPDFPLGVTTEDWNALLADGADSPLVNRAAQGLYAPGSTFKLLVAAAALEAGLDGFALDCTGSERFGATVMNCFDGKAHGHMTLDDAMAQSCNVYFAALGEQLGAAALREMAERFGFNQPSAYPLEYSISAFSLTDAAARDEMIETAIGQGKTLATPLQMAMVAAAIANGGLMMNPYILDSVQTRDLRVIEKLMPVSAGTVLSPAIAARLADMMAGVVATGTGKPAQIANVAVAGKTGTAQNETGNDHSWFVGFAPAEQPAIAIAVLLEETGGGTKATALAKTVMEAWLKE